MGKSTISMAMASIAISSGWWCNKHLEKYEFVNEKDYPIYEMENNKCLKPTSNVLPSGNLLHNYGKNHHRNSDVSHE